MELKLFLEYLKNNSTNQEIADSLGISRTTAIRIRKQLGLVETPVDTKRLEELDTYTEKKLREIVYKKKNRIPSEEDFARILEELKYPDTTLKSVYTKLHESEKDLEPTSLSYVWFTELMKSHFERKDLSDRVMFKPWQYLEFGRIEVKSRIAFLYAYLPYSRYVIFSRAIREKDPTHATAFLFEYLAKIGGVPEKIICPERINKITGREDNRPIYDLLSNLNRVPLVKKDRCVFKEKEKELVSMIQKNKTSKNTGELFVKISTLANDHNYRLGANVLVKEEKVLNGKSIIPEDVQIPFRGTYEVNRCNGHVKFNDVWYSCPYKYAGRKVKLSVEKNYLIILDPENQDEEIARHELFKLTDRPYMYVNTYSTLPGHTPQTFKEWDDSTLQSTSYYIERAKKIYPPFANIVEKYLQDEGPKGTLLLLRVMSKADKALIIESSNIEPGSRPKAKDIIVGISRKIKRNIDEYNNVTINEINGQSVDSIF
ncbi:MAG: hypothetical protein K6G51_03675 [Sphaerochaetaceae bacterium]|nr:hypothetical protein [Sphaerochaetaceae bacterium]